MIELWRDDMLEAMLDIDSQMRIKGAGSCARHMRMFFLTLWKLLNNGLS